MSATPAEPERERQEAKDALLHARRAVSRAEAALTAAVADARVVGLPWREVAEALGVTTSSAHSRFS